MIPHMNRLLVFIEMKQKKIYFLGKKIKMADSKKPHFPAPIILNIFSWIGPGWVELIDAMDIGVA